MKDNDLKYWDDGIYKRHGLSFYLAVTGFVLALVSLCLALFTPH